jgi:hypothetical protein
VCFLVLCSCPWAAHGGQRFVLEDSAIKEQKFDGGDASGSSGRRGSGAAKGPFAGALLHGQPSVPARVDDVKFYLAWFKEQYDETLQVPTPPQLPCCL